MIEVSKLTVRFGGVTSLDGVDLRYEEGTCGLIGPNGAGKTTFFNVLSGFVVPAAGTVLAFGSDLLSMPHYRRARWGLRRTFQTEQAIEELSVFDNVGMVHEHSKLPTASRRDDVLSALSFVGLEAEAKSRVGTLGAGDRRLVEMARAVVGRPRLVLLDEPAAGLPDEETEHLAQVIRQIPERTGALVILVDHDMSLVSATCA
ncbi:MAG: ATP-binding cassette domain-containing protein, partial [Acidimicrobiales bacterium]|nr:ATP-binding cassette domain-containing protein [Acidimicrobiales bacterium]